MKLTDLQPHFVGVAPGHAIGITFLCPHCRAIRLGIVFDVPIGDEHTKGMIAGSVHDAASAMLGMKQWALIYLAHQPERFEK